MTDPGPETAAELSDSLTLGFLALLDQLAPVERAVFVLADVFDVPYAQIATTVGRSQAACRQIASRARRGLRRSPHADQPGRIRLALSIAVHPGSQPPQQGLAPAVYPRCAFRVLLAALRHRAAP